jgi:hypothetical protein
VACGGLKPSAVNHLLKLVASAMTFPREYSTICNTTWETFTRMLYQVTWLVPDRVIYVRLEGQIDFPSYRHIVTEAYTAIRQSNSPTIYWVMDMRRMSQLSVSIEQIRSFKENIPALKRMAIIKPDDRFLANRIVLMAQVMVQLLGWDYMVPVDTWAAALGLLSREDPSLDELLSEQIDFLQT